MAKKYIKINLNQVVSRFQMEEMELNRNRNYMAIAACFFLICIFSFMSYTNHSLTKLIESREADISALNKKINSLKKAGQIDLSKKDIEGLFSFESNRNYWTPKLQALTDLTPKEMVIEELEFDKGKLNITAITGIKENVKEFDVVEKFMNTIKEHPDFSNSFKNIRFINSHRTIIQGQTMFTFKVQAKLNKKNKKKRKKKGA